MNHPIADLYRWSWGRWRDSEAHCNCFSYSNYYWMLSSELCHVMMSIWEKDDKFAISAIVLETLTQRNTSIILPCRSASPQHLFTNCGSPFSQLLTFERDLGLRFAVPPPALFFGGMLVVLLHRWLGQGALWDRDADVWRKTEKIHCNFLWVSMGNDVYQRTIRNVQLLQRLPGQHMLSLWQRFFLLRQVRQRDGACWGLWQYVPTVHSLSLLHG